MENSVFFSPRRQTRDIFSDKFYCRDGTLDVRFFNSKISKIFTYARIRNSFRVPNRDSFFSEKDKVKAEFGLRVASDDGYYFLANGSNDLDYSFSGAKIHRVASNAVFSDA